jgi:putative transposase
MTDSKAPNVGTKLQLRPNNAPTDADRPVRRPKPRLNRQDYAGRRTYHITLIANARAELLGDLKFARVCEELLLKTAPSLQFALLAYCFMPDHLHVLLQGESMTSDLLRFVQRFKQITGYRFKHETGDHLWQQSFHDRVLRLDESRDEVARYIFDNPSAGGLPDESPAYQLRGGEFYQRLVVSDGAKAASLHLGVEAGGTHD